MSRLSEHFMSEEFECRCCNKFIPCDELVQLLESIRFSVQRPIVISSGTRCEAHNRASGGDPKSWHLKGQAVDIPVIDKLDRYRVVAAAISAGATDIGVYDWGVHVAVNTPIGLWRGR